MINLRYEDPTFTFNYAARMAKQLSNIVEFQINLTKPAAPRIQKVKVFTTDRVRRTRSSWCWVAAPLGDAPQRETLTCLRQGS
jgi:hypothetical protein